MFPASMTLLSPPTPPNQTRNGWFPASMCADDRSLWADDPVSLCADDSFAMCADDPLSMCADDPFTRRATLLHFLLPFHTYLMLCCSTFSCASTLTSCYEPEQLALLMFAKLGKEPPVCEALGQKAHKKEFFFGRNTDFRQTVGQKNWQYLYAAVWRKSVKGNVLNNLGQLCA